MIFGILFAVNSKRIIKGCIGFFAGLALITGALFLFFGRQEAISDILISPVSAVPEQAAAPDQTVSSVRIAATEIAVEIATSSAAVQKGLSGRSSLGENRGMLFIFGRPDVYHFWMPDMRFPIDIIWIDNGQVVDADENVSPKFDPLRPIFYTPGHPVRYVLEVNAGFMKRKNIRIGDPVTFYRIR